jgi:Tfp pilus assembly PilM family ATPase
MMNKHWQLGLSFTNHHIRLVVFDGHKIVSVSTADLPKPFSQMRAGDPQELAAVLKDLRAKNKTIDGHRDVVVSLGDEEVFTRILTLPPLNGRELLATAPHELESDLPLKADEMYVDMYELRRLPDGQREYMAFAVNRQLVHWLVEGLQAAKFRPRAIETVSLSLGRLQQGNPKPYLTVDVGSDYASMAVFSNDLMHVNTSVAMHDEAWSKLVNEPAPTITLEELTTQYNRLFSELTDNIQATVRYFQNRSDTHEVASVFISGSGAHVPHLDILLNKDLALPVRINKPSITTEVTIDTSYLPAIGAALHGRH